MYRLLSLLLLVAWANPVLGQRAASDERAPAPAGQALVDRALANELRAAEDASHPMRYLLRKRTPRLTTTKEIAETRDGAVARLVAINDKPLGPADEAGEEARLNALLANPARQRRRKQAENLDTGRVREILRAMPSAFVYRDAGPGDGPAGKVEKFTFRPNPAFAPSDLVTQILPAMAGTIWIDPVQLRVVRLEGRLQQDVNFGWGIAGRLNKGGWISIEQADVGEGRWRAVRFEMRMSGRVVFKNRVFDTTQEQTGYTPVPVGMGYRQGIQMLLSGK